MGKYGEGSQRAAIEHNELLSFQIRPGALHSIIFKPAPSTKLWLHRARQQAADMILPMH
jgi:hypothetical protein